MSLHRMIWYKSSKIGVEVLGWSVVHHKISFRFSTRTSEIKKLSVKKWMEILINTYDCLWNLQNIVITCQRRKYIIPNIPGMNRRMDIAINVVSSVRLAFQPLTILRASTSARNTRMLNSNAKYADGYGRTVKQLVGLYKQVNAGIWCRFKFTSYI